jgi:CspA family cold shock protein
MRRKASASSQPADGGTDVFVHIRAVERAGMRDLNEGQKMLSRTSAGKSSADNLKPAFAYPVMPPFN